MQSTRMSSFRLRTVPLALPQRPHRRPPPMQAVPPASQHRAAPLTPRPATPNRFVGTGRPVPKLVNPPTWRHPFKVQDDDFMQLLQATDATATTAAAWHFDIKPRLLEGAGPRAQVLSELHVHSVRQALQGMLTQAQQAGLEATLEVNDESGITLRIDGPADRAPLLLDEVCHALTKHLPTPDSFRDSVAALQETYTNAPSRPRQRCTPAQKAAVLRNLTLHDARDFARRLADSTYVLGSLHGDMTADAIERVRSCLAIYLGSGEPYAEARQRYGGWQP